MINVHDYSTNSIRNPKLDPHVPQTSAYGIHSLKYSGCMLWNGLTEAERNIMSMIALSCEIKKLMISEYDL